MYKLHIPVPPSINDYYGHHCKFNHATVYIKTRGKDYRKIVDEYIIENNLKLRANIPLALNIIFTPKTKHRQDVDNVLKCALDSLTKAEVWDDDSLIYKLTIEKRTPNKENSGLEIEITKYTTP